MMKKRGFTLIELMVSIAIISILTTTLFLIFNTSIKLNKKSYEAEFLYKQNNEAILYIQNLIRKSYKIDEIKTNSKNCNFKLYINYGNEKSTYSFKLVKSKKDNKNYLCSVVDNNPSTKSGTYRITLCEDFYLFYSDKNQTIKIILNPNNPKTRYESLIYVGDKL